MADRALQINIGVNDQASGKLSKLGDTVQKSFQKVQQAANIASVAMIAFATKSVVDFADAAEKIDNFSKSTGLSAQSASAFKLAADNMGSSIEAVGGGVKKMQLNLAAFALDTDKAKEALDPLNLKFSDLKDLKPEDQFAKIGTAIAGIEDPTQRTAAAVKLFGKSGTDLLPMFESGTFDLKKFGDEAKRLGLSFDEISLKKGLALDQSLDSLKASFGGIATQLAVALAPALTSMITALTPIITSISSWISLNPQLAATIGQVGLALTLALSSNPISASIGIILGLFTLLDGELKAKGMSWAAFGLSIQTTWLEVSFWTEYYVSLIIFQLKRWTLASQGELDTMVQEMDEHLAEKWGKVTDSYDALNQLAVDQHLAERTAAADHLGQLNTQLGVATGEQKATLQKGLDEQLAAFKKTYGVDALTVTTEGLAAISVHNASALGAMAADWHAAGTSWVTSLAASINANRGLVSAAINTMKALVPSSISTVWNIVQRVTTSGGGGSSSSGKTNKAAGGAVTAGRAYMVGERGQEMFVPNQSGTIIPNNELSKGNGITVIVTGNTLLDRDAGRKIGDLIMENLRLQRRLI